MSEKKQEVLVQAAFRVSPPFIARLDKVAVAMSQPGRRVKRSEVLRMAAFKGLDQLELESSSRIAGRGKR